MGVIVERLFYTDSSRRIRATERVPVSGQAGDYKTWLKNNSGLSDITIKKYSDVFKGEEGPADICAIVTKQNYTITRSACVWFVRYLEASGDMTEEEVAVALKRMPRFERGPVKRKSGQCDVLGIIRELDPMDSLIASLIISTGIKARYLFGLRVRDVVGRDIELSGRRVRLSECVYDRLNSSIDERALLPAEYVFYTESVANIDSRVKMFNINLSGAAKKIGVKNFSSGSLVAYHESLLKEIREKCKEETLILSRVLFDGLLKKM